MANIAPEIAPTNDPNYLFSSKTPSRSDYNSLGQLFGDVGNLAGAAVDATDKVIQQNIRDKLYKEIDTVRAAHGGELDPDQVQAIAGTGARGAHYEATVGIPGAQDDLGKSEATLPPGVERDLSGLKKMNAAYRSGDLSNSHYYAELEKKVQEIRAQYPGYREQIDSMVSSITGVTPANALRTSILSDMNSMSAAANSAQNKIMAEYHSDNAFIQMAYPGMTPAQFAANPDPVRLAVGKLKAREQGNKITEQELAIRDKAGTLNNKEAYAGFQEKANGFVSTIVEGTFRPLQDKLLDLNKQGATANPQELQDTVAKAQALRALVSQRIRSMAAQPFNSADPNVDPEAYAYGGVPPGPNYQKFLKADEIQKIHDEALAPIDTMIALAGVKESGAFNSAKNISVMQAERDKLHLTQEIPSVRVYGAMKDLIGPNSMERVFQMTNGAGLDKLTQSVLDVHLMNTTVKTAPPAAPVSEVLKEVNKTHPADPGTANITTLKTFQEVAQHKDPAVAFRAVQVLYNDPKFFANVSIEDKSKIYKMLGSPDFTKSMVALGEKEPQAFQLYSNWMETNFPTVFNQAVSDLQSTATYTHYNWSMNPKTWAFAAETKDKTTLPPFGGDPAVESVMKINQAMAVLRPVMEAKYGDQALPKTLQLLNAAGFDPNATKKGSFFEELTKKMQEFTGAPLAPIKGSGEVAPGVNLNSSSTSDLKSVIRTGEASGNYDAVFGHPAKEFPLQKMTVGEVMGLQRTLKTNGSPSTAAGAYQIIGPTLAGLVKEGVVKPDDLFDSKTQDKLADALLTRRGLADFQSGKMSKEAFLNSLAKEWAALPTTEGRSFYAGDGLNKSTISLPKALASLAEKKYKFKFGDEANPPNPAG